MRANDFRARLTFAERTAVDDGYGNTVGAWADQFTTAAAVVPRFGGEEIMAARLAGKNIATITVRHDTNTARIAPAWKATDTRTGDVWDIKSPPVRMPDKRGYIEMLGEKGGAA